MEDPPNKNQIEGKEDKPKNSPRLCGRYLGITLALAASVVMPLGALAVKALKDYHTFSICVWRFQGILLPGIPLSLYLRYVQKEMVFDTFLPLKEPSKLKTLFFLLMRGLMGSSAIILQFYSFKYISIADSTVICFATPVFVTLAAHVCLGEKSGIIPVIAGVVVLLGVGVIARPPLITGEEEFNNDNLTGACLGLGSMIFASVTFVILRYLRELNYAIVTTFFGLWGTGQSLVLAVIVGRLELPQGMGDWGLALGLAGVTFVGQMCQTLASKFETAGTVSLCRTMDVVFAFLWQFLFLGVVPDRYSVGGAAIVVFGILLVGIRKWIDELPEEDKIKSRLTWILK